MLFTIDDERQDCLMVVNRWIVGELANRSVEQMAHGLEQAQFQQPNHNFQVNFFAGTKNGIS
jgi:ribosomal protein S2